MGVSSAKIKICASATKYDIICQKITIVSKFERVYAYVEHEKRIINNYHELENQIQNREIAQKTCAYWRADLETFNTAPAKPQTSSLDISHSHVVGMHLGDLRWQKLAERGNKYLNCPEVINWDGDVFFLCGGYITADTMTAAT